MICPKCHGLHVAKLYPTFSFSVGWFGRVRDVHSGWAAACWNCATEFMVAKNGQTLERTTVSQPQIVPSATRVRAPAPVEEPPMERLLDDDFAVEPRFR